jgi:hypothetical protein
VHGAAIVLGAAIDMRRGHGRLAAHRRIAERGVEARVLVRDGNELGRLAALRVRLGDRLLIEADLRAGGEEHVLDAGFRHGGDDGIAVVVGRDFDPGVLGVAQVSDVLHG